MDKPRCSRRIHVLGLGSIGLLIAHSLMRVAEPPVVTLLLHRQGLLDKFNQKNSIRVVTKKTGHADDRSGFRLEVLEKGEAKQTPFWRRFNEKTAPSSSGDLLTTGEEVIQDLVVACKGPATISAIQSVKHRINSKSTICLMQNGMGQVDELNQTIFTKPEERPTYVLGIMSHGLYLADTFTAVHAGLGTIALGVVRDLGGSTSTQEQSNSSTNEFLDTLTEAPALGCSIFDYQELLQLQLEKLTVNCVLNPLTALLDVHNGQMLNNTNLSRVHNSLISEISTIIRTLPELKGAPDVESRFSVQSLTNRFVKVTELTATNSSSMREDVRGLKDTEIDYINGYIIRKGKELGVNCATNELVVQLVKGKTQASRVEKDLA